MREKIEIVATLGPSVTDKVIELIVSGATAFRINCSHISIDELSSWINKIDVAFQKLQQTLPLWLDLKGAKVRLGKLNHPIHVCKGDLLTFVHADDQSDDEIPLPHKHVFDSIQKNEKIFVDDGRIVLKVIEAEPDLFHTKVFTDGELNSFKAFTRENVPDYLAEISPADLSFIEYTKHLSAVGYAMSYIQTAEEIRLLRQYTGDKPVIGKIERLNAFNNLIQIADCTDGTWLCRGDLGVEAHVYNLFHFEKVFSSYLNNIDKPFLIAGQVMQHMVNSAQPTRSEVAHLGYLIESGFSGIVLSDETAIGQYPIDVVKFCSQFFDYLLQK